MKMWVSVTSSTEVGNIIRQDDLQIETYTEQMVAMFNAIVSRDAQSPHGKFYFVAKRLQERFTQIKEGTTRTEQGEPEHPSGRHSNDRHSHMSRQNSANQTPLHLLSEIAMGSSNTAASQQQAQAHTRSQQQAQAALQAAHQAQQPMHQNWFPGMSSQSLDVTGIPQANIDLNFDFTQFDLGTGSDADLSALFIPDSMMWGQPFADPNMTGYQGF
jgi:type II secretory pathway pseudopilin PulG